MTVTKGKGGAEKKSSPRKAISKPVAKAPKQARDPKGRVAAFAPLAAERQQVMLMAALGYTQEQMARQVRFEEGGISVHTLTKHFRDEVDNGGDRVQTLLAANLFAKAMGNGKESLTASLFLLKCRFQWIDRPERSLELETEIPGQGEDGVIHVRLKLED